MSSEPLASESRAASSRTGTTAALARFISAAAGSRLPACVERLSGRAFANWIGCALGAVTDESLRKIVGVARGVGGAAQASIVGRSERIDVVNAALVNGFGANALDFDDMHVRTLIHPTGAVVAAALALAEREHASGALLASAIAVGIEIECRLGLALFPGHYNAGWHITSTLGTLGAAGAASTVLRLAPERAAHALGIAATQAGGLRSMLDNPCKSFNIGRAAAAGTLAALLAAADLDSAPDAIETQHGLMDVFGATSGRDDITRGLGTSYLLPEVSFKPYPCGVVIHPTIDACLELAHERPVRARDVSVIRMAVHPRVLELAGRRHPATAIGGRFSVYHAAALALNRQSAGIAAFDQCDIADPELAALRERMQVEADASLRPGQARLRIQFVDGRSVEQNIDHPSGSPERPLTDDQLRAKFLELATRAVDEVHAAALFESCLALGELDDVAGLRRHWAVR